MKEAGVAPPGVMPIQQPTMQLRRNVSPISAAASRCG